MKLGIRSILLKLVMGLGLLPADSVLLYDENCYAWNSGFGNFAYVLYSLVRSAKPKVVVEVGSAYGKSTCYIAAALQRNGTGILYSIDPHAATEWNDGNTSDDTWSIVNNRLASLKLSKFVSMIRSYSFDAIQSWHLPIDLLLLDGSHSYQDVKKEFEGFLPFVSYGGLILFHDSMWEYHKDSQFYRNDQGVPCLVQDLIDRGYPVVTLQEGWGLSILQNSLNGFPLTEPFSKMRR